jgi:hypothetical protein
MHDNTLEFARTLYERITNWYKNAEFKAQVILGLTGTLIAFIATAVFTRPGDISAIVATFDKRTWFCLTISALGLILGLTAAIISFWAGGLEKHVPKEYKLTDMFFFGHIRKLKRDDYIKSFRSIDERKELEIYTHHIHVLSDYVFKKQRMTNYGFTAIAISIIFLLLASVFYLTVNSR